MPYEGTVGLGRSCLRHVGHGAGLCAALLGFALAAAPGRGLTCHPMGSGQSLPAISQRRPFPRSCRHLCKPPPGRSAEPARDGAGGRVGKARRCQATRQSLWRSRNDLAFRLGLRRCPQHLLQFNQSRALGLQADQWRGLCRRAQGRHPGQRRRPPSRPHMPVAGERRRDRDSRLRRQAGAPGQHPYRRRLQLGRQG